MTSPSGIASRPSAAELEAGASYYARTPALLIDAGGVIADINAAGRELLGLLAAGCQGQHFRYLEERLRSAGAPGLFPPDGLASTRFREPGGAGEPVLATDDLRAAVAECRLRSDRFGPVRLRVTELPRLRPATGGCVGSMLSLDVLEMGDPEAFRRAVDRRLGHALMWEVYAASYDRILPELAFYREVVARHCAALAAEPIRAVLDLGAGTGNVAIRLLEAGKRVVAVDVGRAMLARLESKVGAAHRDRLTIVEDTAESLPHVRDESFDGVNVLLAFFDMDEPALALNEAVRALRPGGVLVTTEPRACFDVGQLMAAAEADLRADGRLDRLADDWRRIQVVAPLVRDAIQQARGAGAAAPSGAAWHAEAIFEFLDRRGFGDLTFRESHLGNCATIRGTKPPR